MANSSLLWVRDAILTTTDVGDASTYGSYAIDLLWKARTGTGLQSTNPTAPISNDMAPAVEKFGTLGNVPGQQALPTTLPEQDVTGAIIERIRMTVNFYLSPAMGDTAGNRTNAITEGHYEGIVVFPTNVGAAHFTPAQYPHPGSVNESVSWDWLHWQRVYAMQEGQRVFPFAPVGTTPSEKGYSHSIDTRCSRRIREQGSSLYYFYSASPNHTLNGFSAAWSVLLRLPSP